MHCSLLPKTGDPETKYKQIYLYFLCLKAILDGIWPSFPHKKMGRVFIRKRAFIRMNIVNSSFVIDMTLDSNNGVGDPELSHHAGILRADYRYILLIIFFASYLQ